MLLRRSWHPALSHADHLLITGDVAGPGAGLVAFTRGVCSITTSFEADESDDFEDKDDDHDDEFEQDDGLDDNDMSRGQSTMGLGPRASAMSMPDMMVHGCVRLPAEEEEGDAGSAFGVPDVEGYMTWTCGLMVRGTFNCLRGDAASGTHALPWPPALSRAYPFIAAIDYFLSIGVLEAGVLAPMQTSRLWTAVVPCGAQSARGLATARAPVSRAAQRMASLARSALPTWTRASSG